MTTKRVLCSERVRQIPTQFSWLDHRLVRERYLQRCDPPAAALYLFLVTVADAEGLSYYADGTLVRGLSLAPLRLAQARDDLLRLGLIAWQRPLYQVLSLDVPGAERGLSAEELRVRIARCHLAMGRAP